jgi:hypothetical protein
VQVTVLVTVVCAAVPAMEGTNDEAANMTAISRMADISNLLLLMIFHLPD